MAVSNDVTGMALFCDFENVALGVRGAHYEQFDINKVAGRSRRRKDRRGDRVEPDRLTGRRTDGSQPREIPTALRHSQREGRACG